jgi:OOP family OmpA-OmpF porin
MRFLVAILMGLVSVGAAAQTAPPAAPPAAAKPAAASVNTEGNNIVASGSVPSEALKSSVLDKLRKLYPDRTVVDHMQVDNVVTPANWDQYVTAMLTPSLKQVTHGQLQVEGNVIRISGDVPNEAVRQAVVSDLSNSFNRTYQIRNNLRIAVNNDQQVLDQALANRTVEFQSGSAILTPRGREVLDEMATAIAKLNDPKIALVGNTDSSGNRQANIELSLARANTVKAYMGSKGIPLANMTVSGSGPDHPIADNATDQGRARNRRIDFTVQH